MTLNACNSGMERDGIGRQLASAVATGQQLSCSARWVGYLPHSSKQRQICGLQTLNPLFDFRLNLGMSVARDHVMTRALRDVTTNLDGLSSLGDLINMWSVLDKLSYGVGRSPSPE
jgi:hypothetical protein